MLWAISGALSSWSQADLLHLSLILLTSFIPSCVFSLLSVDHSSCHVDVLCLWSLSWFLLLLLSTVFFFVLRCQSREVCSKAMFLTGIGHFSLMVVLLEFSLGGLQNQCVHRVVCGEHGSYHPESPLFHGITCFKFVVSSSKNKLFHVCSLQLSPPSFLSVTMTPLNPPA